MRNTTVSSFTVSKDYSVYLSFFNQPTNGSYNLPESIKNSDHAIFIHRNYPLCPTFYVADNTTGPAFELCSSENIPTGLSNVSSLHINPGHTVSLYAGTNYTGEILGNYTYEDIIESGSFNLSANITTRIQSISISINCLRFYDDYNQTGTSFNMCLSNNVPNEWTNRVRSFTVPEGLNVELFFDNPDKYAVVLDTYETGSYNLPEDFTHRLRHLMISNTTRWNYPYVTFYSDRNGQGKSADIGHSRNMYYDWNNQISSFKVPQGYTLELYQGNDYLGKSIGPYTAGPYNVPSSFRGPINSAILQYEAPILTCPKFSMDIGPYVHADSGPYAGYDYSDVCSSGSISNPIYSQNYTYLKVPKGFKVQIYSEANYKGRSFGHYTQGTYKVPADINFATGSARVTPLCPTFYKDINNQVDNIQLCSSGSVPKEWKDQITAFYVPDDYFVSLYKGSKYRGGRIGPYGTGYHNVTVGFRNKVTSVLIGEKD